MALVATDINWGGPGQQALTSEDLPVERLRGFTLQDLAQHDFPERRPVLVRSDVAVFREGHLGQVYAERGFGKTWFLLTLALIIASGSRALGFTAPEPRRVLFVDGEMAGRDIQERMLLLCRLLQVPFTAALTVVASDWQDDYLRRIDTPMGQALIEPFVEQAEIAIFDNRSCLFNPDAEKDPTAWQPAQDYLLSLRRRGKAVLVAHHANRMGGARGHSKSEDAMDCLIKLARPEDYQQDQGARFNVTFEKSRGAHGAGVAPFLAHLTADGWITESIDGQKQVGAADKLLDYLRVANAADERPKSANAAIGKIGINRNIGLAAWADLLKSGVIRKHHEGGFFVP
jgi:hypothetical protein